MTTAEKSAPTFKVPTLFLQFASGGLANAITSSILNPMDVSKTRMQAEQAAGSTVGKSGLLQTAKRLFAEGGVVGLWRPGLSASICRELVYSGSRAGMYVPVRNYYREKFGSESVMMKIAAAMTTGSIGAMIANPIDVVKIRLMVNPTTYPNLYRGMNVIIEQEGIKGLYKGLIPSTLRGATIACGEIATYDQSKTILRDVVKMPEGIVLHTIASIITGLVATTVSAPFDIVKTRAMNSTGVSVGLIATVRTIIREEGIPTLFRGWLPSYLRHGPHALICFPILEQLRHLFGLGYV